MKHSWTLIIAAGLSVPSIAHAQRDSAQLAVAESALAHGDLNRAVDLARDYTYHHGNDWRGWLVQGEATLARGGNANDYRVAAIIAYRHATQLAPERLEVWDGYGRAGLELAGADGELILHEAYETILAADPFYPNAWERWLMPWRDGAMRERMRRILAKHDSIPDVRARIARLLIEDERYADANLILDPLVALDLRHPGWLALRAQSAFEDGDTTTGVALYDRALANADRDGVETLWQQAVGIATPNEIRQWEAGVPAAQRPGWLRSFWARRDPDLFAGINQRVAEHFARLREARKQFRSTFPLSGYKNRPGQRAMALRPSQGEQMFYQRCEAREMPGGPTHLADQARAGSPGWIDPLAAGAPQLPWLSATSVRGGWAASASVPFPGNIPQGIGDALPDMPYTRDLRDVDTTAAAMGYNLRTGLDDRGITYLRFGAPRKRIIGSTNNVDPFCQIPDLERWVYDDIGTVRFFRPEAVVVGARSGWTSTGEQVFRPMGDRQFEAMETALTKNATSVLAPLSFGVWVAEFAGRDAGVLDVVVATTRGAVAAQLNGATEAGTTQRDSSGIVTLQAKPGRYALTVNATVADTLGRQGLGITLRPLGGGPSLSDLLLAPAWPDTVVTREAMLGRLQRDLTFGPGTSLRAYGEVYGLRPGSDGHVRYRASYQIYPTRRLAEDAAAEELPGGVRHTFDRVRFSAGGPIAEWLDIAPEQLPAGRYLLRLEIMEPRRLEVIGRAQVGFEIRSR